MPDEFLKKGHGIVPPVKKTDHKCVTSGILPPVPKCPGPQKKEEKPQPNFRVINIKKAIKTKPKPIEPRYESQLEKELREQKIPQLRRTFGYAETPLKMPDEFLKKGHGIVPPVKKTDHKCVTSGILPPVPKCPGPQKKEEKPQPNFRVINIKKAIKTKPKPIEPRLVDTRDGHIKKIKGSGEVPEFCIRPDFGRLPRYLVKRNRKIKKEMDIIRRAEENKESLCKAVSEEERMKLLADLKYNWQIMQKAFLQLPMLTDTTAKIIKKTKMEQELRELEKDIALIENNPYIYIY